MPEKGKNAIAFHGTTEDGAEVVGIGNLRVVIVPDGESWFAQGLEIDYAVQGETVEDAKKQFEAGLTATVHEHLRTFGCIDNLLAVAPQGIWKTMLLHSSGKRFRFSQVTTHEIEDVIVDLGFDAIQFLVSVGAAEISCSQMATA